MSFCRYLLLQLAFSKLSHLAGMSIPPIPWLMGKLNKFILVFYLYSTSNAPKTMELCFPRASCLSHLPSILLSIQETNFWLVVVWKIIDWQQPKAKALPISRFFVVPFCCPKQQDDAPPHDLTQSPLLSSVLSIAAVNSQLIVMCCCLMAQPPKVKTPPSSLFFDGACIGAPNKGTNSGAT